MAEKKDRLNEGEPKSKGNGHDEDDIRIEVLDAEDTPPSAVESYSSARSAEDIAELEKQLEDLRKEKEDIYDRLLRKHADFDNYRKRAEKDRAEFRQYALADLMSELIFILDNFERALAHSEDQAGAEYRKGVELIYRQFRDVLEKRGLKAIESVGKPFDPNYHEAILREERNDLPDNTILEELQKGYAFNNRLLRAAMVKVSYRNEQETEDDQVSLEDSQQNNSETEE